MESMEAAATITGVPSSAAAPIASTTRRPSNMLQAKQRIVDSLTPFQNQSVLKELLVQQEAGSHRIDDDYKLVWRRFDRPMGGSVSERPVTTDNSNDNGNDVDEALVNFEDILIRWKWEETVVEQQPSNSPTTPFLQLEMQVGVATLTSLDALLQQQDITSSSKSIFSSNNNKNVHVSLQIAKVVVLSTDSSSKTSRPDDINTLTTFTPHHHHHHRPLLSSIFRSLLSLEFLLLSDHSNSSTLATVGELEVLEKRSKNDMDGGDEEAMTLDSIKILTAHNLERLDDFSSRMDGLIWKSNSNTSNNSYNLCDAHVQARNLQLVWTGTTLFVHIQALDHCEISTSKNNSHDNNEDDKVNSNSVDVGFEIKNTESIGKVQLQFQFHHQQQQQQPQASGGTTLMAAPVVIDEDLTVQFNQEATFGVTQRQEQVAKRKEEKDAESTSSQELPGTASSSTLPLKVSTSLETPASMTSLSRLLRAIVSSFISIPSKNSRSCWSSWRPLRKVQLEAKCFTFVYGTTASSDESVAAEYTATTPLATEPQETQQQQKPPRVVLDQFSVCTKQQPEHLPNNMQTTPGRSLFALQVGKMELSPMLNISQFQVSGCWDDSVHGGGANDVNVPTSKLDLVSVECGGPLTIDMNCEAKALLSKLLEYLDDAPQADKHKEDTSWIWLLNSKIPHATASELVFHLQPKSGSKTPMNDETLAAFQGNAHTTVRTMMQHYADTLIDRIQRSEQRFVHRLISSSKMSTSFSDTVATTVGRSAVGASIVAPIGLAASVAAVGIKDGVQNVTTAGKERRGATQDDTYQIGDLSRGIVAGVQNVAARGRRSRGAADDTHKLGDFSRGIAESFRQSQRDRRMKNQLDAAADDEDDDHPSLNDGDKHGESYLARHKSRYGGVVGSSVGAVAGLAVLGPVGMVAGSVAGGVAVASYIDRLDESTDDKATGGSEQRNSTTGENSEKEGVHATLPTPGTADTHPTVSAGESTVAPELASRTPQQPDAASPSPATAAGEAIRNSKLGLLTRDIVASGKKSTGRDENSEYKFGDFARGLWAKKKP